jgi:demethylmenaquinone methyltransferase / 2-methoxy-6-polyprenyl-1,4-benzoquinol methylase
MTPATGTTPKGITSEEAASRWVRGMFGRVAARYDLLNHLLSFNLDRRWRARTVERVADVLTRPGAKVRDLCCGTGDVLLSLAARQGGAAGNGGSGGAGFGSGCATIFGSDFCHPMLIEAQRKIAARGRKHRTQGSPLFEADALALPLAAGSLDLITVAFGFRNLTNYRHGLEELARVLKPGGVLAILEFSQPTNRLFAGLYGFFSTRVLPWVGGMISGSRDAYSYLPESIKKFPGAEGLAEQMQAAGFSNIEFERLTFGAVALHLGKKESGVLRSTGAP